MKTRTKASNLDFDFNEAFPETGMFLDFIDDNEYVPAEKIRQRVDKVTEQYSLEEILEENDMSDQEALALLYELGYVGLPEIIEYDENENEEIPNLQDEDDGA